MVKYLQSFKIGKLEVFHIKRMPTGRIRDYIYEGKIEGYSKNGKKIKARFEYKAPTLGALKERLKSKYNR